MQNLEELSQKLGYTFKDQNLLKRALTHTSISHEKSYERLEFLGDRILGAIVADLVFNHFPDDAEGKLSKRFTGMVCSGTLAKVALRADLDKYIIMARAELSSGGRKKQSILADVCESVIAALYLDGGMQIATEFVEKHWLPLINEMGDPPSDSKTDLQELTQSMGKGIPIYTLVKTEGPDHAPLFTVEVRLEGFPSQKGQGPSKRIAEQNAAKDLLKYIRNQTKT